MSVALVARYDIRTFAFAARLAIGAEAVDVKVQVDFAGNTDCETRGTTNAAKMAMMVTATINSTSEKARRAWRAGRRRRSVRMGFNEFVSGVEERLTAACCTHSTHESVRSDIVHPGESK